MTLLRWQQRSRVAPEQSAVGSAHHQPQASTPPPVREATLLSTHPLALAPTRVQTAGSAQPSMRKSMRAGVRRIVLAGEASPRQPSVEQHANALLAWLRNDPHLPGHYVPVEDLKRAYLAFCRSQKWRPHRWNVMARCLRELTGGGKPYRRVAGKRVRVYLIPKPEVMPARECGA